MTNNNASALPTPSDLDECAAMTVADALKIILANSYAIYLKTKNFHWHVSGPYFRDYHLLLARPKDGQHHHSIDRRYRAPPDDQGQ